MSRKALFYTLAAIFYLPLGYVIIWEPELARSYTLQEIGMRQLLLVFTPPLAGLWLWFWALYDWGTRSLNRWPKLIWLVLIVVTIYIGATAYFITVGLRERPNL